MLCPYCDAGVNPDAIKTGLVTGERSIRCDFCNEIIFEKDLANGYDRRTKTRSLPK